MTNDDSDEYFYDSNRIAQVRSLFSRRAIGKILQDRQQRRIVDWRANVVGENKIRL